MGQPRALLIEPPYGDPKMEPNGLLYLATYARQHGFEVDVLYESPKTRFSVEHAAERAIHGEYDVVGVTAMTPTLPRALAILRAVRAARPAATTVLGGYHATTAHDRVLARHAEVDVAVRGEGELTFLELLQQVAAGNSLAGVAGLSFREAGRVVVNELRPAIRDLDTLPVPRRDLGPGPDEFIHFYDVDAGRRVARANVTSSRGCPYSCGFCVLGSDDPRSPISMRSWRARTPENVVDEIENLVRQQGVEGIVFAEDNFTVSPRRLSAFADLVLERNLSFIFSFDSRANQICRLEEVIPKLRRAGLRTVEVGVESGSQAVLDRFAKGTKVSHNADALRILRDNDIYPRIDFIMFEPYTTLDDLGHNFEFLRRHAPPLYDHARTVYHKLELHPGTDLQRQYLSNGLVRGEPDEIIPYEFVNPEIERIYHALDHFYWNHQLRLNELAQRIHFLQLALVRENRADAIKRLALDLVFVMVPLHALPLRLFGEVLLGGSFEAHAIARRVRPFETRVDKLHEEVGEILSRHDLGLVAAQALTPLSVR